MLLVLGGAATTVCFGVKALTSPRIDCRAEVPLLPVEGVLVGVEVEPPEPELLGPGPEDGIPYAACPGSHGSVEPPPPDELSVESVPIPSRSLVCWSVGVKLPSLLSSPKPLRYVRVGRRFTKDCPGHQGAGRQREAPKPGIGLAFG